MKLQDIAVFCLCSIMFIPCTSWAGESAPFGFLYGTKDLSYIHFTCHFLNSRGDITVTKSNVINCEFEQLLFIPQPTAEETAQKQAEDDKGFELLWKELSKNAMTELKKLCSDPKETKFRAAQEKRLNAHKYAALFRPRLEDQRRAVDRFCACTDLACLHDAWKVMEASEAQQKAMACKVIPSSWKAKFRRVNDYWASTSEGSMCHSSETATLSREKGLDSDWWNMRTVKVPRPDAGALCLKETTDYEDSWVSYDVPLTCKTLHLGF